MREIALTREIYEHGVSDMKYLYLGMRKTVLINHILTPLQDSIFILAKRCDTRQITRHLFYWIQWVFLSTSMVSSLFTLRSFRILGIHTGMPFLY